MHMLCPKCETSTWLGTTRPSGVVHCGNCGIVLIKGVTTVEQLESRAERIKSARPPAKRG